MEIQAFAILVIPFILIVYLAVLMSIHPPKAVIIASLVGGVIMGILNALFDLLAYYAHLWHYTLNGLILHLPVPFYITPILIYGSIAYFIIWRFWSGRFHWIALLVMIGVPLFRAIGDIMGWLTSSSYTQPDSPFAIPLDTGMWFVIFFAGFLVFRRLALKRETVVHA